ncbi:secreted protein [Humibacillus xanthopallidus]|uniref:Secreted protein n=1 Tax=Humibacillus xanthopallidus TaxID=412689 RepID=A0A543PNA1_9MICO|nr:multicopper oxidase domain-containing protein [Humibacillus xanthopallidus]TQN45554.1 secreted protein [Humibacillus xanthopallidus]
MSENVNPQPPRRRSAFATRGFTRRRFLGLAGGAVAVAGGVSWAGKVLVPEPVAYAASGDPDLYLAGTDGWIHLPETPAIPPYHPDVLAPAPFTTYIFGFRNVTGMTALQKVGQKNKAQHSAPLFWVKQFDPAHPVDFKVQLTNLGLQGRPDLFDAHTLHWHGFRNVIPFFDGEPTGSVAVPSGRDFTYVYRPRDPGTYMYHCHVEDVEHVHMGMTGLVFVRPLQDGNTSLYRSGTYLYNDGDGSTGFDREFSMFLSEVWAEAHWADAHIQLPEWSDYHADFSLLNGRVYPDTIAPNGSVDPFHPVRDPNGDLIPPTGRPDLQYQPLSSLVTCNAGDRVALRFANLGFREQAMTLSGIRMRVLGRDATPMRGRDGTDTSYETETLDIGPGESYDVIFEAPDHQGPGFDTYLLYNRNYTRSNNLAPGSFGGQATEVRVYAANTVQQQQYPNDWGI